MYQVTQTPSCRDKQDQLTSSLGDGLQTTQRGRNEYRALMPGDIEQNHLQT